MSCIQCPEKYPCCNNTAIVKTDFLGFTSSKISCVTIKVLEGSSFVPIDQNDACKGNKIKYEKGCFCDDTNEIESQNICILKEHTKQINESGFILNPSLAYNNVENKDDANVFDIASGVSNLILFYYYKAARDCLYHVSLEACQVIANLCTLRLYDITSIECGFYTNLNQRM